jgi:hypothetical protein
MSLLPMEKFQLHPSPPHGGMIFVDHEATGRSGHLGHALVEASPGQIIAFFPNCSDVSRGHNGDGWMEFKFSNDGGRTWSEPRQLDYSKKVHAAQKGRSVMCERAVRCDDNSIVLFTLECGNTPERKYNWTPVYVPRVLRSEDGGNTWSEPFDLGTEPARVFDAINAEGEVLVLKLDNNSESQWYGHLPEHHYSLWASHDHGRSFAHRSNLPIELAMHGYGTLALLEDGSLAAYIYDQRDEFHLQAFVSSDSGRTWSKPFPIRFEKRIRNPKIAAFRGGYVMQGRSGSIGESTDLGHLALYCSDDGFRWDEGQIVERRAPDTVIYSGAYSNNLLVHDSRGIESPRLLVQSSHAYRACMTNIHHHWLE